MNYNDNTIISYMLDHYILSLLSANADYEESTVQYHFSNTSTANCADILIYDDDIVEENETLSVRLIPLIANDTYFEFTRQEAIIVIRDNDCKST